MKLRLLFCVLALWVSMLACDAGTPKTFQKLDTSKWVSFEIREGVDFDRAWNMAIDIIINDFDLEMAQKEDGYIRTAWLYAYGGPFRFDYRVRVTMRFSADHKTLRVKTEANLKDHENWILGVDSRLVSTIKTDLMGTIGRTTR